MCLGPVVGCRSKLELGQSRGMGMETGLLHYYKIVPAAGCNAVIDVLC